MLRNVTPSVMGHGACIIEESQGVNPMLHYTADRDLGLLDVINLAQCAARRAELAAGSMDGRFTREYWAAHAWATVAKGYRFCWSVPVG